MISMAETRGTRLRQRREAARIDQKDLAQRAGVSVRSLQYLEQGQDADRNMRKTANLVEDALNAMLTEQPAADAPASQRRLRAVEAYIRDEEDLVVGPPVEVRPGVRTMTIVLLDSEVPVDDATRDELQRILDAERQKRPNG